MKILRWTILLWNILFCNQFLRAQGQVTTTPALVNPITCISAATVPGVSSAVPGASSFIPDRGQVSHVVSYQTSGTIKTFALQLEGSFDNVPGNFIALSPVATNAVSGVIQLQGVYRPFMRCHVTDITGGGSVTATYTGSTAAGGTDSGAFLFTVNQRTIATGAPANTTTTGIGAFSTPFGGAGGLVYYTFSDALCAGSTMTVEAGPDATHLTTIVNASVLTAATGTQTVAVTGTPANVARVTYTSGCATATTIDIQYAFANSPSASGGSTPFTCVSYDPMTQTLICDIFGVPSSASDGFGNPLNGYFEINSTVFLHNFGSPSSTAGNTFLGFQAGNFSNFATSDTGIGFNTLNGVTSGSNNTAVGRDALANETTGGSNTALGNTSLQSNTTGSLNTAVGFNALNANTTAGSNTAVGWSALASTTAANNTAVGLAAGGTNTTGSTNTFIGVTADASAGNLADATALGFGAVVSESSTQQLGDTNVTRIQIGGPHAFASLAACAAGLQGSLAVVNNSNTATWGATIAGAGANKVLAYCDGTNWTVAAK